MVDDVMSIRIIPSSNFSSALIKCNLITYCIEASKHMNIYQ